MLGVVVSTEEFGEGGMGVRGGHICTEHTGYRVGLLRQYLMDSFL